MFQVIHFIHIGRFVPRRNNVQHRQHKRRATHADHNRRQNKRLGQGIAVNASLGSIRRRYAVIRARCQQEQIHRIRQNHQANRRPDDVPAQQLEDASSE